VDKRNNVKQVAWTRTFIAFFQLDYKIGFKFKKWTEYTYRAIGTFKALESFNETIENSLSVCFPSFCLFLGFFLLELEKLQPPCVILALARFTTNGCLHLNEKRA